MSGRSSGGSRLRPLNEPRPLEVGTDARGTPVAVDGRPVETIRERWRIDDEWWRRPVSRLYYAVILEGGHLEVLYRDLESGRWFAQG